MRIFRDIVSGDELFSDSLPMKEIQDGAVFEVQAKYITISTENDFDIGANNSTEEAAEELESSSKQVINIVHFNRLVEAAGYDKKGYMSYIKGYMKAIKEHLEKTNPGRVADFQKSAAEYVKKVLANFDDYALYTGESMNGEAMLILCKFADDGMSQTFYFWKDGLKEEKV
eukprot:NODE_8361_length_685_cov_89.578292_g7739_i0.p1 GENE.NODE_8361_length_685_cov_89.578292_g7739_i0~~NODE_8361_length_685_cov_89.578292_g7739_i0.p1  ORF type:complete len:171 (-),score=35.65 NODE_8361_length_685_cov_89.578292_g7739_i0:118-630(-)